MDLDRINDTHARKDSNVAAGADEVVTDRYDRSERRKVRETPTKSHGGST